ncbi:MAG TPA: porin [Thermoanaerobaculia bacterium]|nr:porin [Thermoanaerobaculia bacterium]
MRSKRRSTRLLLLAPLAFSLGLALGRTTAAGQEGWKTYWKNGTRIESEDGRFAIKIGGRIQADFSFADPDPVIDSAFEVEDGTELRRARLFVEGTIYERFEFKAQYDFTGGDAAPKDVYVGLVDLPVVGGLRIGHFKEPFSLEELTSSKYLPFLERSYPVEAFSPSRNMGLMLHDSIAGDRVTWAAGVFKDADDFAESTGGEWNVTVRLTGLPVADDSGGTLLHLGLGVSARSPADDTTRFRARPQAHLAPRLVDTGSLATEDVDLLGLEAAVVRGPFWAQSEWIQASTSEPADVAGWYVQAGWFLTGETRPYKRSEGVFDRLTPESDFLAGGGAGAWEIALRYGSLDLIDREVVVPPLDAGVDGGGIDGGEQDGVGVALNWYLNSASRMMLDWVTTDVESSGSVDFLLLRLQVDF